MHLGVVQRTCCKIGLYSQLSSHFKSSWLLIHSTIYLLLITFYKTWVWSLFSLTLIFLLALPVFLNLKFCVLLLSSNLRLSYYLVFLCIFGDELLFALILFWYRSVKWLHCDKHVFSIDVYLHFSSCINCSSSFWSSFFDLCIGLNDLLCIWTSAIGLLPSLTIELAVTSQKRWTFVLFISIFKLEWVLFVRGGLRSFVLHVLVHIVIELVPELVVLHSCLTHVVVLRPLLNLQVVPNSAAVVGIWIISLCLLLAAARIRGALKRSRSWHEVCWAWTEVLLVGQLIGARWGDSTSMTSSWTQVLLVRHVARIQIADASSACWWRLWTVDTRCDRNWGTSFAKLVLVFLQHWLEANHSWRITFVRVVLFHRNGWATQPLFTHLLSSRGMLLWRYIIDDLTESLLLKSSSEISIVHICHSIIIFHK